MSAADFSDAESEPNTSTSPRQLVIEAPPWMQSSPEAFQEATAAKVEDIKPAVCSEELGLIAANLPTFFAAKELFKSLDLLRNHAMANLFAYLGGGASDEVKAGLPVGYTEASFKSSWTTVRMTAHRVIGGYALLLNNRDAENYYALLAAARKVYLSWGLFDAVWSDGEEMERVFLKLKALHSNLGNKLYTLQPFDAFGEVDRHGFVG